MKFKWFMLGALFCFAMFIPIGFWAKTKIRLPEPKIKYVSELDKMMIELGERERMAGIKLMPADFENYRIAKCCKTCADSRIDFSTGVRVCRGQFIVNDEMVCDGWQQPEFMFSSMPQQFIEESEDCYGIR